MNETSKRLLIIGALAAGAASFLVTPPPAVAAAGSSCGCSSAFQPSLGFVGCTPGSLYPNGAMVCNSPGDVFGIEVNSMCYICKLGKWYSAIMD